MSKSKSRIEVHDYKYDEAFRKQRGEAKKREEEQKKAQEEKDKLALKGAAHYEEDMNESDMDSDDEAQPEKSPKKAQDESAESNTEDSESSEEKAEDEEIMKPAGESKPDIYDMDFVRENSLGEGIKYYLYIDESGILHPHSKSDYFIFAGLLVDEQHRGKLNANYKNALLNIKSHKGLPKKFEMKASKMNHEVKRYLLSNLRRNCSQVFVVTNIRKLRPEVFKDNINTNRHKNFIISKMVEQLILSGRLSGCSELELNIDNQNIALNAIDNLEGYLHIMFNEDNFRYMEAYDEYGIDYINFSVKYRDSSKICLVQAADLLANTKYREYELEGTKAYRFLQQNAIILHLPLARH